MHYQWLLGLSMSLLQAVSWADCHSALQTDTPKEQFESVEEVYWVDRSTGLMWQKCAVGFTWVNGTCTSDPSANPDGVNWQQALQLASDYSEDGYTDWRLPNIKELNSIVDRSCWSPAINSEVFAGTPAAMFWTSSPNEFRADAAWVISFDEGEVRNLQKDSNAQVRLVRDFLP